MALQDFTISFTTTAVAEFNDLSLGNISPPSNIFADLVLFEAVSMPSNIFADLVLLENISTLSNINGSLLLGGLEMADIIYQGTNGKILVDSLILTDKAGTGEGEIKAVPNGAWTAKGFKTEVEVVTAASVFAFKQDSGKTYINIGATNVTQVVLPNGAGAGVTYNFLRVASQAFRVKPSSGSIIYTGGQMAAGECLELASDGAKLSLISDENGNWVATQEDGTLTEQTP